MMRALQGIGPLVTSLSPIPKGVSIKAERNRKRNAGKEILVTRSKRLQAKKKKRASYPPNTEPGGSVPLSSDSKDMTSIASGRMEVMAVVVGPSHCGNTQVSSNVPA